MRYTFGNTQAAAKRLETIAAFFNPPAKLFITEYVDRPVQMGVDLGCGPGFTTQMLHEALGGAKVFGVDNSPDFLALAKDQFPQCEFIQHDVTITPLPVRGEVVYERFLLPHLTNAVELVNGWVKDLLPGGLLFIDEMDDIETPLPVFRRYLDINTGLVASQGADLFVGRKLGAGSYQAEVLCNESVRLAVSNALAAKWFHPNTVTIWGKEKFVLERTTPAQRKEIAEELSRIRDQEDGRVENTWVMRRMVLRRS